MTYQGVAATPPRLWALWQAIEDRLRGELAAGELDDDAQVYLVGEPPYAGSERAQWWRMAVVPVTTVYPNREAPGRAQDAQFLVRAEVHLPSDEQTPMPMLESLQTHAFERLHGWKPTGLTYATVRFPVRRLEAPAPIPLRDPDRDLWYVSARYSVVVETPDLEAPPVRQITAAPTGLTAVEAGEDVALDWDPLEGADGYRVYKDGALLTSVETSDYVDGGAAGNAACYEVAAYNASGTGPSSLMACVGAVAADVLFADDFDRADETPLAAPWEDLSADGLGQFGVNAQQADVVTSGGSPRWSAGTVLDIGAVDYRLRVDFTPNSDTNAYGLAILKWIDINNYIYLTTNGSGWRLGGIVDGATSTWLFTSTGTDWVTGVAKAITVEVIGDTVVIEADGARVFAGSFSTASAALKAATKVGLYQSSSSANTNARWDNVVVEAV